MDRSSEAERLHARLTSAFTALVESLEGSVETGAGYVFFLCPEAPLPQCNGVWAEDDDDVAVADLADRVEAVEAVGLPFWLQTRQGRHPRVEEQAGRLGLRRFEQVPGMVAAPADLTDLPEAEIQIERVTDESGLAEALAVAEAGFETPTGVLAPFYKATLLELHGLSYYLGFAGGEAVSTAVGYRETDTVGIFNVATPPGNRRRGYGAALTSLAARDGIERGAQLAWLQASQHGEPVYRRMGFRQVETYNLFTRS